MKFSKNLKTSTLIQAETLHIMDKKFNEDLVKCFEFRSTDMKKRQGKENFKWNQVLTNDQNYFMCKKGYKKMLNDIEEAKINLSKFKRGMSIFNDNCLREQLLNDTAVPLVTNTGLNTHLKDFVFQTTEPSKTLPTAPSNQPTTVRKSLQITTTDLSPRMTSSPR